MRTNLSISFKWFCVKRSKKNPHTLAHRHSRHDERNMRDKKIKTLHRWESTEHETTTTTKKKTTTTIKIEAKNGYRPIVLKITTECCACACVCVRMGRGWIDDAATGNWQMATTEQEKKEEEESRTKRTQHERQLLSIFFYDYWNLKNSFQGHKKIFHFHKWGRAWTSEQQHAQTAHTRAY